MFSISDINLAKKIINALQLPESFGSDAYGDISTQTKDEMYEVLDTLEIGDYFIISGASKAVIILDDYSFVIKIAFNGYFYNTDDFKYFNDYRDYCGIEYNLTYMAEEAGFGELVPEMEYIGENNNHSCYIQTKVIPMNSIYPNFKNVTKNSLKEAHNYNKLKMSTSWIALVIDTYGLDFWKSFIKWNEKNNLKLFDDMHSGNYGIDEEGNPVIFDLSTYLG